MSNVTHINRAKQWADSEDDVQALALIPAGDYPVVYVNHYYAKIFGVHKACAVCEITQGDFIGTKLTCSYNVRFANKCYRPPLSPHSYYRIDMHNITGSPRSILNGLRGLALIATVITVTRDSNDCCKNLEHHYSRIQRLRKA